VALVVLVLEEKYDNFSAFIFKFLSPNDFSPTLDISDVNKYIYIKIIINIIFFVVFIFLIKLFFIFSSFL